MPLRDQMVSVRPKPDRGDAGSAVLDYFPAILRREAD